MENLKTERDTVSDTLRLATVTSKGRFLNDVPTSGGRFSLRLQTKRKREVCIPVCHDLATKQLSKTEIDEKNRALVRFLEKLVEKDAASIQVSDVRVSHLEALIDKIDDLFLLGSFKAISYTVCWEQCITKPGTAGRCRYPKNDMTIHIELNPLLFEKTVFPSCANGVKVDHFAMALINVLQHEMVHAIIRYYCKGKRREFGNYSCLGQPKQECKNCKSFDKKHHRTFMGIARNRFGHTNHKHYFRQK